MRFWPGGSICLCLAWVAAAAELPPFPSGLPPIQEIELPVEHDSNRLSLVQGKAGVIHIGTGTGVATFDGRRWTMWHTPRHQSVRSLAMDNQGRLLIGSQDLFGYLRADEAGRWHFTDLSAEFDDQLDGERFDEVWEILVTPFGALFNSDQHLFLVDLDGDRRQLWRHSGRFGTQVMHEGEALVQFRGLGIKRLLGDRFELVADDEALTEQIYAMLPLATGGLLLTRRDGRWLHLDNGRVEEWPVPPGMPSSADIGAAEVLEDGSVALGSSDGRLHLYHPTTGALRSFQVSDNFILSVNRSHHGGLFVQSMSTTAHVAWPSPWLRVGSETGLTGSLQEIHVWNDRWLTIGSSGALASSRPGDVDWFGRVEFRPTEWSAFEGWDWLDLGDRALFANSYQVLEVSADSVSSLLDQDIYPKKLLRSAFDPDRIYVGSDYGLGVLDRVDGGWRWTFRQDELTGVIVSMVEIGPGELLLSAVGEGAFRARFSADHSRLSGWERLGEDHGLASGKDRLVWFQPFDGQIVASTSAGFFAWQDGEFQPTTLGNLMELTAVDGPVGLQEAPDGTQWAFNSRQVWRRKAGERWRAEEVSRLTPGPVTSINFVDDKVLLGGTGAILTFDETVPPPSDQAPGIRLTGVVRRSRDETEEERLALDGRELVFPRIDDYFVFEFAVPEYRRPDMVQIRYRLLGWEERFGEWGRSSRVTFSRLRPGAYRFEAEARDSEGIVSRITPFEFVIQAPWYQTRSAWIIWITASIALMVLLVGLFIRLRLRRAWAEQSRLATMVDQRTAELAAANRKLRSLAHIDGLTAIANRRRLEEYLEEVWHNCAERKRELAVIILDVDHFKAYNDNHGHQAGDDALREVADILSGSLRRSEDLVARYGGEEFICILPGASLETALEVAEQIRKRVNQSELDLTVSLGVSSQVPSTASQSRSLIEKADKALYKAKQSGRNRTEANT